jgi:hypothetical protein
VCDLVSQYLLVTLGKRVDGLEAVVELLNSGNQSTLSEVFLVFLQAMPFEPVVDISQDVGLAHAFEGVEKLGLLRNGGSGIVVEG